MCTGVSRRRPARTTAGPCPAARGACRGPRAGRGRGSAGIRRTRPRPRAHPSRRHHADRRPHGNGIGKHYHSQMPKRPLAERFWRKVDKSGECWVWTGCRHVAGYGRFNTQDAQWSGVVYAHRMAWELTHGPIPPGLHVLHRCDNPPCCNPEHLWLGTNADNHADKVQKGRLVNPLTDALKLKTHCPRGHEFDERNTLWREYKPGRKARACRACLRQWGTRYYDRECRKRPKRLAGHCIRGHDLADPKVAWTRHRNGREYPVCRICSNIRTHAARVRAAVSS